MKILTAQQTREADAATIQREPITSIDLMERAAIVFTDKFAETFDSTSTPVYIHCGPGNNGGDGLAVARLLAERQYPVKIYTVQAGGKTSADFEANRARLINRQQDIHSISQKSDIPSMPAGAVVVDGLFGSGLSRPITGIFAEVITAINSASATTVAIDIPSGLYADRTSNSEAIIRAQRTFTFQMPKLSFMLPYSAPYVGQWQVLDIGLNKEFIDQTGTSHYFTTKPEVCSLYQVRPTFSHKGTFGKAIVLAGSHGKMGAAVICARACLRGGVGLLTVHVPACGYQIMQTAVPEAMVTVDHHQRIVTDLIHDGTNTLEQYNALGIGPGLGTAPETTKSLTKLLEEAREKRIPTVLDADALNVLSKNRHLLSRLPKQAILTPHPKEFERLTEPAQDDNHRLVLLKGFAQKYQVYVVLKGAHTAVGTPQGEVYFNSTGNPGMASGGTGDALTGIITALLAQRYSPYDATILGVYLHGAAGDLASSQHGQEAMLASDLIDNIGNAFGKLTDDN